MGKSKHTPNAAKKDNPFKLMGGARKLRLKKKVSFRYYLMYVVVVCEVSMTLATYEGCEGAGQSDT